MSPTEEPAESAGFVARAEVTGPPLADLAVSWGAAGLVRTLDGKAVPLASYLGVLPVVIWTDREDEILAGVPERRRRMIDAGLVAERPDRVGLLARHRRVLAHKRELLRRRQRGLEAWNRLLAESGSALQRARADWVAELQTRLQGVLRRRSASFPADRAVLRAVARRRSRRRRDVVREPGRRRRRRAETRASLHRTPPRSTLHCVGHQSPGPRRERPRRFAGRLRRRAQSPRSVAGRSPGRAARGGRTPLRPSWSTTSTPSSTWGRWRRCGASWRRVGRCSRPPAGRRWRTG